MFQIQGWLRIPRANLKIQCEGGTLNRICLLKNEKSVSAQNSGAVNKVTFWEKIVLANLISCRGRAFSHIFLENLDGSQLRSFRVQLSITLLKPTSEYKVKSLVLHFVTYLRSSTYKLATFENLSYFNDNKIISNFK